MPEGETTAEESHESLREPVKKIFGESLSSLDPFERIATLQDNADSLLEDWRGKDDGTHVRKVFGSPD